MVVEQSGQIHRPDLGGSKRRKNWRALSPAVAGAGERQRERGEGDATAREPEEAMLHRWIHAYQPSSTAPILPRRRGEGGGGGERERRGEPRFVRVHAGYERMEEYRRRGGEEEERKGSEAAFDLIFKCKQIYIVAKAPPGVSARQSQGNRRVIPLQDPIPPSETSSQPVHSTDIFFNHPPRRSPLDRERSLLPKKKKKKNKKSPLSSHGRARQGRKAWMIAILKWTDRFVASMVDAAGRRVSLSLSLSLFNFEFEIMKIRREYLMYTSKKKKKKNTVASLEA